MTITQNIESMTGFGSGTAEMDGTTVSVEIRSVNGRALDMRLRLPDVLSFAEKTVREKLKAAVSRGNLQVSISIERSDETSSVRLNAEEFASVSSRLKSLAHENGLSPPTVADILSFRSVTQLPDAPVDEDAEQEKLSALTDRALRDAIAELSTQRKAEGCRTVEVLKEHRNGLAEGSRKVRDHPALSMEAISTRLREQLTRLFASLEDQAPIEKDRVAAEAAIIAVKADVSEEIDRFDGHLVTVDNLLSAGGVVGKRLEFICQELNREANTLCSKSPDAEITEIGLNMKALIDKIREQAANLA
ncbi:MAG: YicC/YloC family endoribonuclease [Pseudomonadota bacterium]